MKGQRPMSALPLAPRLATAALGSTPLIPVKPWSGNQSMSNRTFSALYHFKHPHKMHMVNDCQNQ